MKTTTFQGREYSVPDWAKWIAMDCDGEVYCYSREPQLVNNSFYSTDGRGEWGWIASCAITPSCEQIK